MTYTSEEILFAMFILKANTVEYPYLHLLTDNLCDEFIVDYVERFYADIFNNPADRGIAEEEFEGWTSKTIEDSREGGHFGWGLVDYKNNFCVNKIKFRFVED